MKFVSGNTSPLITYLTLASTFLYEPWPRLKQMPFLISYLQFVSISSFTAIANYSPPLCHITLGFPSFILSSILQQKYSQPPVFDRNSKSVLIIFNV
jgi:hypothetical protein